ncbi:MAG TPA: DUF2993 domain-containing protein [Chthonomonadales bacterium]|nr:DUF2993 domain-containing protein [Chthonomonadales bacterium]
MTIRVDLADIRLRGLRPGAMLRIEEARLTGADLQVGADGRLSAPAVHVSVVVTESAANDALRSIALDGLRGLEVTIGPAGLCISGRYAIAGPITVPFRLQGRLRVRDGARLELEATRLEVVGAAWPGFTTGFVQDRINGRINSLMATGALPFAARLLDVAHETGRLTLRAECDIDLRTRPLPPPTEPAPGPGRVEGRVL